jgi:hypothetical protein
MMLPPASHASPSGPDLVQEVCQMLCVQMDARCWHVDIICATIDVTKEGATQWTLATG